MVAFKRASHDGDAVAVVRAARERIAAKCGFDVDRLVAHLRAEQSLSASRGVKIVRPKSLRSAAKDLDLSGQGKPRRRPPNPTVDRVRAVRRLLAQEGYYDRVGRADLLEKGRSTRTRNLTRTTRKATKRH